MKDAQYIVYKSESETWFNPVHAIDADKKVGACKNGVEIVFIGSLADAEHLVEKANTGPFESLFSGLV